jgi:hypothetical protein
MTAEWGTTVARLRAVERARDVETLCEGWYRVLDGLHGLVEREDALTGMMLARVISEDLERMVIPDLVRVARHEGASWADIGQALDVTRQSARERYRAE